MRSTATALLLFTNLIHEGFNQKKPPKRTVQVALDLSKAFDSVNITLLLEQIASTDLHPNISCWLATYLRGRSAAVIYQEVKSMFENIHIGMPQGSVLSPALFNFFVSDCPVTLGLKVMFADNFSAAASAVDLRSIKAKPNANMITISDWPKRKHLKISPEKSQVMFLLPDRKESYVYPQIFFEGSLIPLQCNARNLGLILDRHGMYNTNAISQLSRIPAQEKVIKAITGSGWGLSLEDALMAYKATVMPVTSYLVRLLKPVISKIWIAKIQVAQNNALDTIMGCHAAASMDHLHQECKLQPVDNHLDLLAAQFLADAMQPHYPSHEIVTAPPATRPNMKPLLQTLYGASLTSYLNNYDVVAPVCYKKVLSALHMSATQKSTASLKPNRVLGTRPPEVSPKEKQFPCLHRTALNRVRLGFCKNLKSYQKFRKTIRRQPMPRLQPCPPVFSPSPQLPSQRNTS
jgi:hypothetical protein